MKIKDSFRYKLNDYSHKTLDKMFSIVSPIARETTVSLVTLEVLESELYNTELFAAVTTEELQNKLDIDDVFMQDICKYLHLYKHIEVRQSSKKNIIKRIVPTKLGYKAYKFETYLEKNEKLVYQEMLEQSTLDTNKSVIHTNNLVQQNISAQKKLTKTALVIAGLSFFVSVITLAKEIWLSPSAIDKQTQQVFQKQQLSIDSLKQNLSNINFSLKNLKTTSHKIDTTKTK